MCIVNHEFEFNTEGDILGVMFDAGSSPCEGAFISWPCIVKVDDMYHFFSAERLAGMTFLHELGHCFRFMHEWSDCGLQYDDHDCPNYKRTIMSYGDFYLSPDHEIPSLPITYGVQTLDWYQHGPESWVKPGRYGKYYGDNNTFHPHFAPFLK